MTAKFSKGQRVTYVANGSVVASKVDRVHRDGTVTVRAYFFLDDQGRTVPGYLGFKFRLDADDLSHARSPAFAAVAA